MIPCKSNKCLLYPACKNKSYIQCSYIMKYYEGLRQQYNRNASFEIVRRDLHNMKKIDIMDGTLSWNVFNAFNPTKTDEQGRRVFP